MEYSGLRQVYYCIAFVLVTANANASTIILNPGGLGQMSVPVKSFKELKFHDVVRQAYDFSCGSAAVATLLSYHYEYPLLEKDVFISMYENGDKAKIQEKGFSMLDMKLFLESRGYNADGFRITLDKLIEVDVAAIALINTRGYSHFVVVKAADSNRVLLSDPALGNRVVSRPDFEEMWNGIFFVVHNNTDVAKAHFNAVDAWKHLPSAPLGEAISRTTLSQFTMSLSPRLGDF